VKLITFSTGSTPRVGALVDGGYVDLTEAGVADDMVALVARGDEGRAAAEAAIAAGTPQDLAAVEILAPIVRPPNNVMAVGRNYREHALEFTEAGYDASEKKMIPDHPIIFTKATTSIIGPDAPIIAANDPLGTPDYEGELGVIIGPGGRGISRAEAYDHVYGYTVINDVTARDLQKRHIQFFIGKSPDTFCPMGPYLVTRDEVPDIESSMVRTRVNGELRQEAPVAALIFDIPTLIETLSSAITLLPGDVIATGTPKGVGMGQNPPQWLQPGDVVEISVDGVGTLRNPVA
jgi:2-keto-4-pentenoate hydratase/2-oxohepta-3-ene-1,7-dioic acid hydratase in catechol pathway